MIDSVELDIKKRTYSGEPGLKAWMRRERKKRKRSGQGEKERLFNLGPDEISRFWVVCVWVRLITGKGGK